jgi:amino acid transporter
VLAEIISVATLISYITGPVTVMTLRRTAADFGSRNKSEGRSK